MSHYSVLVAAKDEDELFEKLIPYYEYGCDKELDTELEKRGLLEFVDMQPEYRERWETDSSELVKMLDGRLLYPFDDEFRIPGSFGTSFGGPNGSSSHKVPEGLERVEVPHKELYPTFDQYMEQYAGYTWHDDKQTWGYYKNPNAKWDWYVIGGRWEGYLKLKHGHTANTAFVGQVNWNAMLEEKVEKIMDTYYQYRTALDEARQTDDSEKRAEAEKRWTDNEYCRQAFKSVEDYALSYKASDILMKERIFLDDTWQETADKFYKSEEEYLAMFSGIGLTWAFIDTCWHEKAEMGWWGCSNNPQDTYPTDFWTFVNGLAPEQRIYVVDCHI